MTRHTYFVISMPAQRSDEGLSEVIGFILILALIAALASLYITYVVPAQGRELEIKHMAGINDQFLQYKVAVDSLWVNNQRNVPLSNTFTLGTVTGLTQGGFVIPIFQPYPSSGTISVNGRGDTLTISGDFLEDAPGSVSPTLGSTVNDEPGHLYIQVMTTDTSKGGGLVLKPDNGNWEIWLNVTSVSNPGTGSSGTVPSFPTPTSSQSSISWTELKNWLDNNLNNAGGWITQLNAALPSTGTSVPAITMTMAKNGNAIFSDLVVVRNVQNNTWCTIDLLDDAYGLREDLAVPFTLVKPFNQTSTWVQYRYPGQVGYRAGSISESHRMGSLEFRSGNTYWVQQDYYYQQGGVFLWQPDGMVAKVVPLISVTNRTGIPTVRMVDIIIDGKGTIGGTSPVQVVTTVTSLQENTINNKKLARGIPNAKNVTLVIDAQDRSTAQMWNQAFGRIRQTAVDEGFDQNWINITQNNNTVQFTVHSNDYAILFDYSQVNLEVYLQPVAI
jgi:hypothetical protein